MFQSQTGIEPAANAARLVEMIDAASAGGAAMLFTPEMSGMLDRDAARATAKARAEKDDEVLAAGQAAAKSNGVWVHLGSLAIRREDGKLANRGFVIDAAGDIRARYDKIHLFDVDLPTGERWRESALYAGGSEAVMAHSTPIGELGLSICYDLRFPALFERLSEAGADVIAVPAAFTVPTGRAHWEVLMRARAIETSAFVVAAAQVGTHEDGRATFGHSLVIDPWGEIILDMAGRPGLAFAEIDLERIAEVRARIPVVAHRKPIAPIAI